MNEHLKVSKHHTATHWGTYHVEVADGRGRPEVSEYTPGHDETVDGRMRTASGAILELASFGPLWVPPGQLKEGGSAHEKEVQQHVRPETTHAQPSECSAREREERGRSRPVDERVGRATSALMTSAR